MVVLLVGRHGKATEHDLIFSTRLRIQRVPKGKKSYDIHTEAFAVDSHIKRGRASRCFPESVDEYVDLVYHCRLKSAHGLVVDGLSHNLPLGPMTIFINIIEDAGMPSGNSKFVDVGLSDSFIMIDI